MQDRLTQEQVEQMMYRGGIIRAEKSMARAEEGGRAHQNPYAAELFRNYVLPLAGAIKAELKVKKAGARQAHAVLLDGLDAEAVAFLAVRSAFNNVLSSQKTDHRKLAYSMGMTVHQELVLEQIAQAAPDLYHTLTKDLGRRLSKSEKHKMAVMRNQAAKEGIEFHEWNIGSREQVGFYLLQLLLDSGLLTLGPEQRRGVKHVTREVYLHPEVMERIDQIKGYVSVSMPVYGPCVAPPHDWGHGVVGGYHTPHMRAANGSLVHARPLAKRLAREADMPVVYAAVNALQRTAWQVNGRVLDTVYEIAKSFNTKEIVSLSETPAPSKPEWLGEEWTKTTPKEQWPTEKMAEFLRWKRDTTEWHTERKLLGTRYGRFYAATRAAEMFRQYEAIYFVYFADSRGRLYPLTYGMNPQGSDLSKALLRFAEGKPLHDDSARLWFHVQGANKWGFDKATLQDRMQWVIERHDLILSFADAPLDNRGWLEAGDPLQFLAWCFEYADWCRDPSSFKSHLPISMDGSCNGLQNLSAMFRDEVGGQATNLTNNKVMEDIYTRVAQAATVRLTAYQPKDEAEARLKRMWLEHGINRKAVKRSVMTTPYGVTERSATEYVIDDYLREGLGPTFDKMEYRRAAQMLMNCVWPAIGDVVVKGREAMDWLKKSARVILDGLPKDAEPAISWRSPSGFIACQDYFEAEIHRINTRLHGPVKIRVLSETDDPDKQRHANGLAPNFVHSLDAAHLHLTTADAKSQGIDSLAMIHDDYGTHAADAQKLYDIIRKQFVAMYLACDPPADFKARYPWIAEPPGKGSLDIMEVLESAYFFS